jgi:GntR family transcriptional regulator
MVEFERTPGPPIYIQIRDVLRAEITGGGLKRGEQLPSEIELAARFNVSRMTIRESTENLVNEGLLYRRHGVGTFVAYPHLERDHTKLTSFFDEAEAEGVAVQVKLLSLKVIPATPKVAEALDIPAASHVFRVKTLRCVDGVPITLHDAHIPYGLFASLVNENLEVRHLWKLFEKAGYRVKRAIQRLEAREASKQVARWMEIQEGAPVLFKERTVYADDGTPVEFTYCYNRGDLYSLTVALER